MKTLSAKLLTLAATAVVSCALFSQNASAVPINGNINFGGSATFDTTSLATATKVTNWQDIFGNNGKASVTSSSGSFSGFVAPGTSANFTQPYTFNPSTATVPLWQVGGFTFNLLSSTIISQTATFLNITGVGTITGNGFMDTTGMWSFTSSKADGGQSSSFSFAANTSAIPEGGSALALLGVALMGVEVLRRKLASA